jgi:hypothetical protein
VKLQRELQQPWIADVQHLPQCSALIRYVAIYGIELGVVPDVEDVGPQFHLPPSPNLVCLEKLISQLLIPGPQQIERGALSMVPGATVAFVNKLGSKA